MSALDTGGPTAVWARNFASYPHEGVERTALRLRSHTVREPLAVAAGTSSFRDAIERARSGEIEALEPRWLESLALVVGMQSLEQSDTADSLVLYEALVQRFGSDWLGHRHRLAFAELLLIEHRLDEVRDIIDSALPGGDGRFLRLDVENPVLGGDAGTWSRIWRDLFAAYGLDAPTIDENAPSRFDGLTAPRVPVRTAGPFVSVVMTAYRPGPEIFVAARSILAQSWRNLELIVVDDASGAEFDETFAEVRELDDRVRVHRLEVNGGTYVARNIGIGLARGSIVAGMDSDDWSHPLRIEHQLQPLLDNTHVVATRCRAWTVSPSLGLHRRGFWPERWCEGSLMFRRDDVLALGSYVACRRGADSELVARLRASGRAVVDVPEPLWVTRIEQGSLSRSDFFAGWHHPARLLMRGSYEEWHARIAAGSTSAVSTGQLPQIPDRLALSPAVRGTFDLVVANDWRYDTPSVREWLELVSAVAARGGRVALTQLDDPWFPVRPQWPANTGATRLVNAGIVGHVAPDEACTARALVVTEPRALAWMSTQGNEIAADRVVIVADVPGRGAEASWSPVLCDELAQERWDVQPIWLPRTSDARRALEAADVRLYDQDLPVTIDAKLWPRRWQDRRARPAVLGALVSRADGEWAVPDTRGVPSRGGVRALAVERQVEGRVTGSRGSTTVLYRRDVTFDDFLRQIDVIAIGPGQEGVARIALECAAAGVVVVAPGVGNPHGSLVRTSDSLGEAVWSDVREADHVRASTGRVLAGSDIQRAVAVLGGSIGTTW